jgi:hypothetical protein
MIVYTTDVKELSLQQTFGWLTMEALISTSASLPNTQERDV